MKATGSVSKQCRCTDPETGKRLGTKCPKLRRSGGGWSATHGVWDLQLELPTGSKTSRNSFAAPDSPAATTPSSSSTKPAPCSTLLPATRNSPFASPAYCNRFRLGRRCPPRNRSSGSCAPAPIHIQDMFTAIDEANQRVLAARSSSDAAVRASVRGQRITGPASQHRIRAALSKALNDAIRIYKLIDTKPATAIDMPAVDRPRAKVWTSKAIQVWKDSGTVPGPVMVWRPDTASEFLDYAEAHGVMLYALLSLVAVWGLRPGEACGLRDIDVDLDNGVITIVRQRTSVRYKPIEKEVKSRSGERILPVDKYTAEILAAYRQRHDRWRQLAGDDWPGTGLFFVRPDGTPWHPEAISNRFELLLRDSGLPPIRFHDLRYCAASYLKLAGADMKTIQEILGRSSIVITSDTYTALFADLDRIVTDGAANIIHLNRRTPRLAGVRTPHKAAAPSRVA